MSTLSRFGLLFLSLWLTIGAEATPLYQAGNNAIHDTYLKNVQPIINARCVACHGCYEAPCQLNLETYEGLRRGFNPEPLYSGKRAHAVKPTRMIDASSLAEWRDRGFSSVLAHQTEKDGERLQDSLMFRFLDESKRHNAPGFAVMELEPIQKAILETERHQCIATQAQLEKNFSGENNKWGVITFESLVQKSRHIGMPFGLPRLAAGDATVLQNWMEAGAHGPSAEAQAALEAPAKPEIIAAWESFLNDDALKAQHTARYLYEHLFTAQVHFDENPGEYFDIVRSRTKTGAIDQIVTELPYDAPGVDRVYYRLKKITRARVHKTQIVWQVNDDTLAHLKHLFLDASWATNLPRPAYDKPNPFEYFAVIPPASRAQFMIENSRVIIGAMTQGSVCVGSRATYAIRDHFWVYFLKPGSDPSVSSPSLGLPSWDILATAPLAWEPRTAAGRVFLAGLGRLDLGNRVIARRLITDFKRFLDFALPDEVEESAAEMVIQLKEHGMHAAQILGAIHHFVRTTKDHKTYQLAFETTLRHHLASKNRQGLSVDDLWSNAAHNPNAWLSVTRHEKSASVQFGAAGGRPQNAWILSYSNFERLYYNLVVSFKNWGEITHKLATWRHMSYVRQEGEDLFISLLPAGHREEVREMFTRGLGGIKNSVFFPLYANESMYLRESRIPRILRRPDSPNRPAETPNLDAATAKQSYELLLEAVTAKMANVAWPGAMSRVNEAQQTWEAPLVELGFKDEARDGKTYAKFFPNVTFIKVTQPSGESWGYSVHADRGYQGNNLVFLENLNRDPKYDTIAVYRGFVGAYPNLFIELPKDKLADFVADIRAIRTEADWASFRGRYGVARNSARFWPFFDWLHEWKATLHPGNDPVEQGIADLSQYLFFEEGR